jgi:hypothetical protein
MNAFGRNNMGLACLESELHVEPFVFPGINGRIERLGDVWQFWECHGCGNATFSKPFQCEKCYGISFEFIRLWSLRKRIA